MYSGHLDIAFYLARICDDMHESVLLAEDLLRFFVDYFGGGQGCLLEIEVTTPLKGVARLVL